MPFDQLEIDVRIQAAEFLNGRTEHDAVARGDRADHEAAGNMLIHRADIVPGGGCQVQNRDGAPVEKAPEQRGAQLLLELLDLHAERRLRDVQLERCLRHAAGIDDGDKIFNLLECHDKSSGTQLYLYENRITHIHIIYLTYKYINAMIKTLRE